MLNPIQQAAPIGRRRARRRARTGRPRGGARRALGPPAGATSWWLGVCDAATAAGAASVVAIRRAAVGRGGGRGSVVDRNDRIDFIFSAFVGRPDGRPRRCRRHRRRLGGRTPADRGAPVDHPPRDRPQGRARKAAAHRPVVVAAALPPPRPSAAARPAARRSRRARGRDAPPPLRPPPPTVHRRGRRRCRLGTARRRPARRSAGRSVTRVPTAGAGKTKEDDSPRRSQRPRTTRPSSASMRPLLRLSCDGLWNGGYSRPESMIGMCTEERKVP